MPTALQTFQCHLRSLEMDDMTALDARAIAIQGDWVITSLNMTWVPEGHILDNKELRARADGRFAEVDCFQWPQLYCPEYQYSVCVPRKEAFPLPDDLSWAWWTPTAMDFVAQADTAFAVGTLSPDKVQHLKRLLFIITQRVNCWKSNRQGKVDIVTRMLAALRHDIEILTWHPLTHRDMIIFVAESQRFFLDIYAHMEFIKIAQHRMAYGVGTESSVSSYGPVSMAANKQWMGCFTRSSVFCDEMFRAGVPVWLIRSRSDIFPQMNIIHRVTLKFPDHIICAQYSDGGKIAKPFDMIYRGPGGLQRHIHTRRKYAGLSWHSTNNSSGSHTASARESADPKRVKSLIVDRGYRFPEPLLLVTPAAPERKKLFVANWLAVWPLWISRVDHNPPAKFPSPQIWRDFLNSIPSEESLAITAARRAAEGRSPTTAAIARKMVAKELFGEDLLDVQGTTWAIKDSVEWR
ncbi:hypothetical protein BJ138DRAFT_1106643, partial [Hygrophoropsis aurantiaca]